MEFKLPDLGEGVHEGEIVKWLIKEGDQVKENQPLVEVMTDKATVEIPSPLQGKIVKIHFKEGETVVVDNIIVTLQKEGENIQVQKKESPITTHKPTLTNTTASAGGAPHDLGIQASPQVRKRAQDLNVDTSRLKGTGPGGRITEEDVNRVKG